MARKQRKDIERQRQWGHNIKAGRKIVGFETQLAFAEALGVTQGTVARWEAGLVAPSDHFKARIAGACRQEVRQMFPLFAEEPA